MDWIGAQYGGFVFNQGQVGPDTIASVCDWLIDPLQLSEQFTNPTLMASRVVVQAQLQNSALDLVDGFGFGLIEWSGKLNSGQPTQSKCPDVFRDSEMDWILRQVFMVAPGTSIYSNYSLVLDEQYMSKAKRRLETGSGILMVASTSSDQLADGYTFSADVRCLIKE
jgi:hypothetical protein